MPWSSSACTWYTRGRPHKYCFYQLYPQFPYLVWRHNTAWTPWPIDCCSSARNGCIYICKVVITIKQCISVKLYLLDSFVLPPPLVSHPTMYRVFLLELESYQLASKQKARFVREAQLEKKHPVHCRMTNQPGAKEQTGDVLQQLVDALRQVTRGPSRPRQFPPSRKERNQSDKSNLVCWKCKEKGHRRRECPKWRSRPAETEVSQSGNEQ